MRFKWTSFFHRWEHLNPQSIRPEEWLDSLRNTPDSGNNLLCAYFLALAFWDSKTDSQGNRESINCLATKLGFNYQIFYQARNLLRAQLHRIFQIDLLKADNGNNQYLRTLQIYSGKMYVLFASAVANVIRKSGKWEKWLEKNKLEQEQELICLGKRYGLNLRNNENLDDQISLQEIADFFRKLIKLHLNRKTEFTIPDIQEYAPVTDEVAIKIISELEGINGLQANLNAVDTGPVIGLNKNGNGVYQFPATGVFGPDEQSPVKFGVKKERSDDEYSFVISYSKTPDGRWLRNLTHVWLDDLLMDQYHVVDKIRVNNGELISNNALPEICREQDHILVRVKVEDGILELDKENCITNGPYIISAGFQLNNNMSYRILSLGKEIKIQYQDIKGEIKDSDIDANSNLKIPNDVDAIIINGISYPCKQAWFDSSAVVHGIQKKQSDPGRMFYLRNENPIVEERLYANNITVVYKKNKDDEHGFSLFDENGNWCEPPDEYLWQENGLLIVKQSGKTLLTRKITFCQDIDWQPIDTLVVPLGKEVNLQINIGQETIYATLANDSDSIVFDYHGFQLTRLVQREGISFRDRNSGTKIVIAPEPDALDYQNGFTRKIQEIAKDDFSKMKCHILFSTKELFSKILLYRENQSIALDSTLPFNFHDLIDKNSKLSSVDSDYYAISIRRETGPLYGQVEFYKFHVYQPEHDPVVWYQYGKDLVCKISCAKTLFLEEKYLCFVPTHMQDGITSEDGHSRLFYTIRMDQTNTIESNEGKNGSGDGKAKVELKIKGFFTEEEIPKYGKGLLCFIARKWSSSQWTVLTSVFSIPIESNIEFENDPYYLRKALAIGRDAQEKIVEIMQSAGESQEKYQFISDFIRNMTQCMTPLGNSFNYLNSFHNRLAREKEYSGYIFMCNAFFKEVAHSQNDRFTIADLERNIEWVNYRAYWDAGMFDYSVFEPCKPNLPEDWCTEENIERIWETLSFKDKNWMVIQINRKLNNQRPLNSRQLPVPSKFQISYAQIIKILFEYNFKTSFDQLCQFYKLPPQSQRIICNTLEPLRTNLLSYRNQTNRSPSRKALSIGYVFERFWRSIMIEVEQAYGRPPNPNSFIVPFRRLFKNKIAANPFLYYSGWPPPNGLQFPNLNVKWRKFAEQQILAEQTKNTEVAAFLSFFKEIGESLHTWRKNTNLKDAQELRDILLCLRKIDTNRLIRNMNKEILLRDIVEWYAFEAFKADKVNKKNKKS